MISRIELKNFMSHPHTVIEPAEGLTVLVGDNNTGKSAVINALQVLCANLSGDYMVRHGAKECLVRVETGEGHELEWRRKGKVVSYRINGRDIHRLGGAVPEDLHDLLRLPRVEAENETFDIHFGEQKDPIFLLNTSPGKRAAFFASSSDTIKLIEMQGLHKRRVQDAKGREGRLVREEERYKKRLEKLAPVEVINDRLNTLEADYKALDQRLAGIAELGRIIGDLAGAGQQVRRWQDVLGTIEGLPQPPVLEDSVSLAETLRKMEKIRISILHRKEQSRILSSLTGPPEIFDTPGLRDMLVRLRKYSLEISREEERTSVLENCPQPPVMEDPGALSELIRKMAEAGQEVRSQAEVESCLSVLEQPPELFDVSGLRDYLAIRDKAEKDRRNRQAEFAKAKQEVKQAEKDFREFIDRTGICPTCGQDMDFNRLLSTVIPEGEQS
ncbi:MAG: AAA family ATPase [Desulfurivibrionaceae bacterium]